MSCNSQLEMKILHFHNWTDRTDSNDKIDENKKVIEKSQNNLRRVTSPPLIHRMESSAACVTSCAMTTADESNHSAAGMLHPHCSATFVLYVTLHCPISSHINCPFPLGILTLTIKSHHRPTNLPPQTTLSTYICWTSIAIVYAR